jgi:ABC-type sugar transport system ATPase subunit
MIRPQGLRPAAPGQIGIEGQVIDARFLGDELQVTVLFEGMDEPWLARISASHDIAAGATVRFAADPAHVFVFET